MKRKEFLKNLDSINKNLKLIKTGNKENKERLCRKQSTAQEEKIALVSKNKKYESKIQKLSKSIDNLDSTKIEHAKEIESLNKSILAFNTSSTTFKNELMKYASDLKEDKAKKSEFDYMHQKYSKAKSHIEEQQKQLEVFKKDYSRISSEIESKNRDDKCDKDCRIIIRKGDLCDEREDAIVNPANEQLRHEGGVPKAIANRGGEVIQAQSQAYILKHSTLPTGFCTTTDSGNLYCKKVIHAVGPVYRNKVNDQIERELMRTTISNIMMELKEQGLKSISIPAISTGIFNFPRDKCASIMGTVIKEHINSDPYFVGCRIVLCNFDEETTKVMLEIIPNIIESQDIREEGTMISDGSEKKEEVEDSDKEDEDEFEEEKMVKGSW